MRVVKFLKNPISDCYSRACGIWMKFIPVTLRALVILQTGSMFERMLFPALPASASLDSVNRVINPGCYSW